MQIIDIKENQKKDWNKFISDNNSESFLQSWEWGEFQKNTGRKIWRLGIMEEVSSIKYQVLSIKQERITEELIAVALVVKHNLPFGRGYLYCPRGPVVSKFKVQSQVLGAKFKVLELLLEKIKKIAKEERCMFLRIDPPIELNQESGIRNQNSPLERGQGCVLNSSGLVEDISNTLTENNFKKLLTEVQPEDTLMLDLKKSEEEIPKEMKQKTRYNIKLAEKKGVKIKYQVSSIKHQDYFEKFWLLTEETSRRNGIISHPKEYYFKMLKALNENGSDLQNKLYSRLYVAEFEDKIIAANIVLFFGDMAIYLHGASSNEYRNVMAPYLLQWKQILDAKRNGYKKYDFWGITIGDERKSWQGITKFKKGFGGHEKSYIGAYDLAFNRVGYSLYKTARKMKLIFFSKYLGIKYQKQ